MFKTPLRSALAALLALPALLGACASTPDEAADAVVAIAPWVASSDIAAALAIPLPQVSATRAQFESGDLRIILFAGQRIASVAGETLELAEPPSIAAGVAWVSAADASAIQVAWRSAARLPRAPQAGSYSGSGSGGSFVLPPSPPPYTAPAAPAAVRPSGANDASPAEAAAWGVTLKRRWDYIVVHHTASPIGSAAQIDKWHKDKGWDGLGYDFVIGNGTGSGDGAIEVGYRWRQQLVGAHVRVPGATNYMNEHGIGICLVGDFDRSRPSSAQMRSLERLSAFLADYCGIPSANLRLHGEVKSTDCPGKHFPRDFSLRPASRGRTAAAEPAPR